MRRSLAEEIEARLRFWGPHPVFVEHPPNRGPCFVSAECFGDRLRETVSFLRAAGVRPGHPVALMLENSALFVSVFLAILALDAVPLPLQTEYRALELDEIMSNASPQALIVEHNCIDTVRPYIGDRIVITASGQRLAIQHAGRRDGGASPQDEGVAALLYTYRGHGYPLGALLPPGQFVHGVAVIQEVMGSVPGEAILGMLPMCHIFGIVCCIFLPLLARLTCVIPGSLHPRKVFQALRDQRITCAVAIPEVLELLWKFREPDLRFPRLRLLISGGSLLSETAYERLREFFRAELAHGYGLTEFTPVSRNIPGRTRGGTVGPVCRGIEVRIRPDQTSQGGEIQVRAANMARGYHRRPKETASAFDGPWFRTGDRGVMRGGHLVFLEEIKRTCKVNGRLVDLQEVVRALTSVPRVRAADVALSGRNVLEARVAVDRGAGDRESFGWLRQRLSGKIASYKIPKRFFADHCV